MPGIAARLEPSLYEAAVCAYSVEQSQEWATTVPCSAPMFTDRQYHRAPQLATGPRRRKSNRDAIGALVTLHAGGRTLVRQVQAAGGYLAQSTLTVQLGLGSIDAIERCEIRWPSGEVTLHEDLEPDRLLLVDESEGETVWER